jgi:PIN domain nuclease of toxin-antitoxin system
MTEVVVVDSSAVLAVLQDEPGAEAARLALPQSVVSAINYAEVIAKLVERGDSVDVAEFLMAQLECEVIDVTADRALGAGRIHERTRGRGISMGDRFCLALAEELGLPVVTGDRRWKDLGLPLDVRLIR